jgi:hypothetical protein
MFRKPLVVSPVAALPLGGLALGNAAAPMSHFGCNTHSLRPRPPTGTWADEKQFMQMRHEIERVKTLTSVSSPSKVSDADEARAR